MKNKGGCKPGHTNNPNGRPPAGNAFVEQLRDALTKVGKRKGKTLIEHAVERAYLEDTVLVALLRKLLPDTIEHTGRDGAAIETRNEHSVSDATLESLGNAIAKSAAENC